MAIPSEDQKAGQQQRRVSSESLAVLIMDALVDGGVVKREDAERAIRIAAEEIDVRKAMGDY